MSVHQDRSFKTSSSVSADTLATMLSLWCQDPENEIAVTVFLGTLIVDLSKVFPVSSGRHPLNRGRCCGW